MSHPSQSRIPGGWPDASVAPEIAGPRLLARGVGPVRPPGEEGEPEGEEGNGEVGAPPEPTPTGPSGGGPDLPPGMRRFLRRGLALFPVVVGGLWALTDLGGWDALFLAALLELLPVLAVAQVPLAAREQLDRPAAYVGSAGAILFLGWISVILGRGTLGLDAMGLGPLPWTELLRWTGIALAGGMGVVGVSLLAERILGTEESEFLRQIIPRTPFEKLLFVGVSLAAGLGEELAYRAYVIPVLAGLVGSDWTAAVLSSGIFGFLHAYQGHIGVVRTGVMGLVLAAVFLWSGSLWPAVAAHAVIDLLGGLVLGPRMLEEG